MLLNGLMKYIHVDHIIPLYFLLSSWCCSMLPHLNHHLGGFGVMSPMVISSLDDHQILKIGYIMYSVHLFGKGFFQCCCKQEELHSAGCFINCPTLHKNDICGLDPWASLAILSHYKCQFVFYSSPPYPTPILFDQYLRGKPQEQFSKWSQLAGNPRGARFWACFFMFCFFLSKVKYCNWPRSKESEKAAYQLCLMRSDWIVGLGLYLPV